MRSRKQRVRKELEQELLEARFPDFSPAVVAVVDDLHARKVPVGSPEFSWEVREAIAKHSDMGGPNDLDRPLDEIASMTSSALAYESELATIDEATLERRYAELTEKRRRLMQRRSRQNDQIAFHAHPRHTADHNKWNMKGAWTLEEAVALSLGKNPQTVNGTTLKQLGDSAVKNAFFERLDALSRTHKATPAQLFPIAEYKAFFKQHGIRVPLEFGAEYNESDDCGVHEDEEKVQLRAEIESLKRKLTQLEDRAKEYGSRKSMQRILYCIAKEKYNYKADMRSEATSKIAKCIEKVCEDEGVEPSPGEQTVRLCLQAAAGVLRSGQRED